MKTKLFILLLGILIGVVLGSLFTTHYYVDKTDNQPVKIFCASNCNHAPKSFW